MIFDNLTRTREPVRSRVGASSGQAGKRRERKWLLRKVGRRWYSPRPRQPRTNRGHNANHYPNRRPPSTQAPPEARPVHPPVRQPVRRNGRRRRITSARRAQDYILTEIPADFGRGFLVEKIGHEESYHVNIDADKRTCECQGYNRWQNASTPTAWPP